VGVGNTIFGLALIYTLDLGLHVPPTNANAIGYAVCIVISFIMSRSFVFQSTGRVGVAGLRYMVVVLIAFLLNQAVLRLALLGLGEGVWQHAAAQLSGMACYTAFTFLGCQLWVFRSQAGKD
jgi:putative flippase GtrA